MFYQLDSFGVHVHRCAFDSSNCLQFSFQTLTMVGTWTRGKGLLGRLRWRNQRVKNRSYLLGHATWPWSEERNRAQ